VVLGDRALHALIERVARQHLFPLAAELGRCRGRLQIEEELAQPIVAHEIGDRSVIIVWAVRAQSVGIITYLSPISCPAERLLRLRDALAVPARYAPLVGAPRRPFPVFGPAGFVVVGDLLHLGGVLDGAAVRADEVAED